MSRWFYLPVVCTAVLLAASLFDPPWRTAQNTYSAATKRVDKGNVRSVVLAEGKLKPSNMVAIGAQVTGRITEMAVRVGNEVKAGDLIARIDQTSQQNAVRVADAALAHAHASLQEKEMALKFALRKFQRQKAMLDKQYVAPAEVDARESTVAELEAQTMALKARILEAEVSLAKARSDLEYTLIRAPIGGTILAIVSQEGQTVSAAQTAPTIVVLGRLDVMEIDVPISEADINLIRPGQQAEIRLPGVEQTKLAQIEQVDPAPLSIVADPQLSGNTTNRGRLETPTATYYRASLRIPNPDTILRPYMTADVRVIVAEASDVLVVPREYVTREADGFSFAHVSKPGNGFERRRIDLGITDGFNVEVRGGLAAGDELVPMSFPEAVKERSLPLSSLWW